MPPKEKINSNIINIEQILVHLDTSIPSNSKKVGGAEPPAAAPSSGALDSKKKMIQLSSKYLYHPQLKIMAGLSDLPYITSSMKYPVDYLKGVLADEKKPEIMDYNKIVEFFFNRDMFKQQMDYFSQNLASQQKALEQEEEKRKNEAELAKKENREVEKVKSFDDKEKDKKKNILNFNIQYMLQMLFPTKFPASINFSFSYDEYIEGTMVQTPHFVPVDYSYLKVDDKIYTVIKVTVLNDLVNNPIYREIIEIYNNFTVKNEQVSKQNEKDIGKMKEKIDAVMMEEDKNKTEYYNLKNIFKTFTYSNELFRDLFDVSHHLSIDTIKRIIDGNDGKKFEEIQIDTNNISKKITDVEKKSRDSKSVEALKVLYTNYKIIHSNINEIYEILKKPFELNTDFTNNMQKIFTLLEANKKSMTLISKNESVTNESTLVKVIDILIEDFKKINELIKINNDFNKENPKINLDKESANIKETLTKKNPMFAKFVEKIKNVMEQHKTNNEELLEILKNFYNSKKQEDVQKFNDLTKNIISELLNHSSEKIIVTQQKKFFEKKENRHKINTGIHYINQNDDNLPHYEIYVAVDLFEGEINESNINKCNYKDYYMGQEAMNIFGGLNYIYDINLHRLFIPSVLKKEANIVKDDSINSKKKGGRRLTFKLSRFPKRRHNKTHRRRCSPFNKMCRYH